MKERLKENEEKLSLERRRKREERSCHTLAILVSCMPGNKEETRGEKPLSSAMEERTDDSLEGEKRSTSVDLFLLGEIG